MSIQNFIDTVEMPWVLFPCVWFLSTLWGSFSGVIVWRVPVIFKDTRTQWAVGRVETTLFGRSHCDHCGTTLNFIDLIPVFGWLIRRGRCRACGIHISPLWPGMECFCGVTGVAIFMLPFSYEDCLVLWILAMGLILLAWFDDRTEWLPDTMTFPVMFMGLLFSPIGDYHDRISGLIMGWLIFMICIVFLCFQRRSWQYMSWGDIILGGALGAWTGWKGIPVFVLLSVLSCAPYLVFRKHILKDALYTQDGKIRIPLGPSMAAGGFLSIIIIRYLGPDFMIS